VSSNLKASVPPPAVPVLRFSIRTHIQPALSRRAIVVQGIILQNLEFSRRGYSDYRIIMADSETTTPLLKSSQHIEKGYCNIINNPVPYVAICSPPSQIQPALLRRAIVIQFTIQWHTSRCRDLFNATSHARIDLFYVIWLISEKNRSKEYNTVKTILPIFEIFYQKVDYEALHKKNIDRHRHH